MSVRRWLFARCCVLLVVCGLLFFVCYSRLVVSCLMFDGRCLMIVVCCCVVIVVCCCLMCARYLYVLFGGSCLLFVAR